MEGWQRQRWRRYFILGQQRGNNREDSRAEGEVNKACMTAIVYYSNGNELVVYMIYIMFYYVFDDNVIR